MKFENLRVRDVRAVVRYRSSLKKWSAKKRKDHIIGIQLHGSAVHDFGYQKFVLSGNCIFFFNQRDDYDVEVLEVGEAFSIHFTTYEEIDTDSFCVPIANSSEVISLLRKAETAKIADDELKLLSLLYRLFAELEKVRKKAYSREDARMLAAKEYIDAHLCEQDCLHGAVAASGITFRRFGTLFRNAFDVTPNRYVVTSRIERAKDLLAVESLSVGDVAELCGFSDVYYFSKSFKRETGVSPKDWNS